MNKDVIVGVDIGGTSIKMGLFLAEGKLCETWSIPTRVTQGAGAVFLDITMALQGKLEKEQIYPGCVRGVGVGVAGPVEGGVVRDCPNLGWNMVPIETELSGRLGLTVKVENDANLAALGEHWKGAAKGCNNFVLFTLGTGIGGAVVVDGHILNGTHGCAGEFGHITVCSDGEARQCGCGKLGCLEQYASATGLVRTAYNLLELGTPSVLATENLTAQAVTKAAENNDALALLAVEDMANKLGQAMAGVAAVCDPQLIIVGGGVSQAGEFLRNAIQRHYRRHAFSKTKSIPIKLAAYKNEAGIWGAASLFSVT